MKIVSWNVAGINACAAKGLLDFMKKEDADVYCFQEVRSSESKLNEEILNVKGYIPYWLFAKKNGYSGVATYTKIKPLSVIYGIGDSKFDDEGRILTLEFKEYFLINAYFPHSSRELKRLKYKLEFNKAFLKFLSELPDKSVIIASDFNVAHEEIDLSNPKENMNNAGFTKVERDWFSSFLSKGYIDTYREFTKERGHYTWWAYRFNCRARNIGWRIDYFIISNELKDKLINSEILDKIKGSDHCPIRLVMK